MLGAGLLIAGCGGTTSTSTPAALALQREDFIAAARGLASARPSVEHEVAATKRAWPLVAGGLPASTTAAYRAPITAARDAAAAILTPPVFEERNATSLTGEGARIAGMFRSYSPLSSRGWSMIDAAIAEIEHGTPETARFARANSPLYIESVYDGHFILGQIGPRLQHGYEKLGGPAAFGTALTQQEVDALADAYSESNDRLHPRAKVRVGS